jgi:hypothetical protein
MRTAQVTTVILVRVFLFFYSYVLIFTNFFILCNTSSIYILYNLHTGTTSPFTTAMHPNAPNTTSPWHVTDNNNGSLVEFMRLVYSQHHHLRSIQQRRTRTRSARSARTVMTMTMTEHLTMMVEKGSRRKGISSPLVCFFFLLFLLY